MKKPNRPIKNKPKVPFITIEPISHGFLINVPILEKVENEKHFKSTINGVVAFMEKAWGVKYIYSSDHKNLEKKGITINIPTTKRAEKFKN